jgi:hypothetical protein
VALAFGLVVAFGDETAAAAPDHVRSGDRQFALHRFDSGRELWLVPAGVGHGLPADRGLPRVELTRAELTALGHALYDVLRTLDGYVAAIVGWELDHYTDLAELTAEWPDVPDGLVLSTATRESLPARPGFEPFTPGFDWLPYKGERTGNT